MFQHYVYLNVVVTPQRFNLEKRTEMKSTENLVDMAVASMESASDDDNTLDRTVYFSNKAILTMLSAVVVELRNIRQAIENVK
ncbi:MAG: hypothetical protein IV113_15980 [Hydrogenophaga sp.]|nr:hypothetical protein [Hydrogenophaga sp.]